MAKSPWLSKTLWFNVLSFIVDAAGHYSGYIPVSWQPYIVMGVNVINLILRTITTQPLDTK